MSVEKEKGQLARSLESGSDVTLPSDANVSKILRKVDLRLLPILLILYLLSFLDRSNIGNARIEGLLVDIQGLGGGNYNTALALFFVGYVIFEIPAQLGLKKTNPKFFLPTLAVLWSIVTTLQGVVSTRAQLLAMRFLLGVTEAGLFPGSVYVFSLYYPRHLRHFRVALYFSGAALAGAFGGILAYGLGRMNGTAGYKGWRWILIIEGLITFVFAVAAYFIIPVSMQKAPWLKAEEKAELTAILHAHSDAAVDEKFNFKGVKQALLDFHCWAYGILFHLHAFCLYSISLFTPTIINSLGYPVWKSQLLSTPPYAFGFLVTMLVAYLSFKIEKRGIAIFVCDLFIVLGYILLLVNKNVAMAYVSLFFIIPGIYAANALVLSWPGENISSQTKRAVALGIMIAVGNCGSITSVLIYRPDFNQHLFRKPNIIALCYTLAGGIWALLISAWCRRQNYKRSQQEQVNLSKLTNEERLERVIELGDRAPEFRYQI